MSSHETPDDAGGKPSTRVVTLRMSEDLVQKIEAIAEAETRVLSHQVLHLVKLGLLWYEKHGGSIPAVNDDRERDQSIHSA